MTKIFLTMPFSYKRKNVSIVFFIVKEDLKILLIEMISFTRESPDGRNMMEGDENNDIKTLN